jgi:2-oxoglutarate ferredoxin oxidoreductase subunit alpha
MKEAVDALASDFSIAMLHFSEVYPLPLTEELDYLRILRYADQTVCIEANASGQFKRLLRAETGFQCSLQVNRYDGRPFTLDSLVGQLREKLRET